MSFHDSFQYQTQAEINRSLPDLAGPSKWSVAKIVKVRTSNLKLIAQAKDKLHIRLDTVWLAEFYFQRYFSQYAFQNNTPVIFVAACLHLACKASDLPRGLEYTIKKTFQMRYANDQKEIGKIDDFMFYTEVKERVLLAERALLYCFSFDFRTSDPYSFALKYHTTYKLLDGDDAQRDFAWLNIAAQATTLCLQYPASLLGVVAVWYAQHLVHGQIPVDEKGLEWWEKLPAERQDRAFLPVPTAAQIEDAHWQLVPQANWATERARLEKMAKKGGKGCLPGEGCHCKVCSLHYDLQERAKRALAEGHTSPQGASDASATTAAGVMTMDAPGHTSALTETRTETGASAPRTGTAEASHAEAAAASGNTASAMPSLHQNGAAQMQSAATAQQGGAIGQQQFMHGGAGQSQHRASPSWHSHQVVVGGQQGANGMWEGFPSRPGSTQAEGRFRHRPPQATPSDQLPYRPATAASWPQPADQSLLSHAQHHAQHTRAPLGQEQAYSPVGYPDHGSPGQHIYPHQQQQDTLSRMAGQQSSGQTATAAAAEEDSGPEDGEIEEGEVLPDGTVADVQAVGPAAGQASATPADPPQKAENSAAEPGHVSGNEKSHVAPVDGLSGNDGVATKHSVGTEHQERPDTGARIDFPSKKRKRSPSPVAA